MSDGGPFVLWIFSAGVLMWTLVIERYWYFWSDAAEADRRAVQAQWQARAETVRRGARGRSASAMISRLNGSMTTGFPVMRVLVPLSPLLGLIGTVSRHAQVFDSMALRGSADARSMASGVSHAMICTMTGLAVSITGLVSGLLLPGRERRGRPSCSPTS